MIKCVKINIHCGKVFVGVGNNTSVVYTWSNNVNHVIGLYLIMAIFDCIIYQIINAVIVVEYIVYRMAIIYRLLYISFIMFKK